MKTMQELEKMSDAELTTFVAQQRATVQQYRFGQAGGNVQTARTAKRDIARALTVLSHRSQATTK